MNDNHGVIRLHGLSKAFQPGSQKSSVLREADAEFAQGEYAIALLLASAPLLCQDPSVLYHGRLDRRCLSEGQQIT
jgi:hypothetical protein